jgi:hypothetical protein
MRKVSIVFHAIATVASLLGISLTFSAVSEYEENLAGITLQKQKISEEEKKLAELRDKHASDKLRQRNRNLDLSDEITEFKKTVDETNHKLALTKEEIIDIEKSIAERISDKDSTIARQSEESTALEETVKQIKILRSEIPRIQEQIEGKIFEISDFKNKSAELSVGLNTYSEITSEIRGHYLATLRALRSYQRTRPWLEPGEELSLELSAVDLASGYIALSEGGASGVREGMIFSVNFENQEISKIRIKKVFRDYSLAELIPLVGNPAKLLTLKKVDLVVM